jgi:hypothetical protein
MFKRLLQPFVLILTVLMSSVCAYVLFSLSVLLVAGILVAVPFVLVWLIPVLYWGLEKESVSPFDHWLHYAGYLSMGWVNFFVLSTVARDVLVHILSRTGPSGWAEILESQGLLIVTLVSLASMAVGICRAFFGPYVRQIEIAVDNLDPGLEGFRIGQISDLHIGPTIKARYVRRVVKAMNESRPDLVALTGDFVDGTVEELQADAGLLAGLHPAGKIYFIPGNHEYYSGAKAWMDYFRRLGFHVLENDFRTIEINGTRLVVAGLLDPAARMIDRQLGPDPETVAAAVGHASDGKKEFRLLLAHNPKIAARAAQSGFHLQLSGHTHAGQFFPWTLVTWLVHKPHFAGLSKEGRMHVYVNAGTGTWGPPIRLGTKPEITIITLRRPG